MSCYGPSGAPMPCTGWTVYDSYVTDPRYQKYFTLGWTSAVALAVLVTLPAITRYIASQKWREGGLWGRLGLYEDLTPGGYQRIDDATSPSAPPTRKHHRLPKAVLALGAIISSISLTTIPLPHFLDYTRLSIIRSRRSPSCHPSKTFLPFSLGTLALALLIPVLIVCTLLPESQLRANPNRFGFFALASIPPLFVLSSKNSLLVVLLGQGWTSVNFLHRWLGRAVVLLVLLHMYFWTIQWVASDQIGLFLSQEKERRGIAALAFLLLIAVSSAGPIRKYAYSIFFVLHYVGVIGFLVFVNRHTVYAKTWATWAVIAIYALDIVGRLASMRVRYVEVEALEGGMVRVGISRVHGGWRAGQHLSIRLFFSPPFPSIYSAFRMFEQHPFSISNAPPAVGVLRAGSSADLGIDLFARSCGKETWTGDLYATARLAARVAEARSNGGAKKVYHMLALVEGPYGGLGPYVALDEENILLVAGGSGMSFTLGVLDELVGRRINERRGGKVDVVWAVRERANISWFAGPLARIIEAAASDPGDLDVSLRIFITCDDSLTTPDETISISSSSSSSSFSPFSLPRTQLLYRRPELFSLVHDTVGVALAPCRSCYPICHCGEDNDEGVCGNDEEECCGNGPANGRELLSLSTEKGGDAKKEDDDDDDDEIDDVPQLRKSCCAPSPASIDSDDDSDDDDEITVIPGAAVLPSCCAPKSGEKGSEVVRAPKCGGGCCAGTGAGCCGGGVEGVRETRAVGPIKVRNGGLAVVVCGPGGMIAEMRNAVARVPVAKQARLGGVSFHAEHFTL